MTLAKELARRAPSRPNRDHGDGHDGKNGCRVDHDADPPGCRGHGSQDAECEFIDAALRAKANCPISRLLNANTSMRAKLLNGHAIKKKGMSS